MNKTALLIDFKNAISRLDDALRIPHDTDLEKAGCIQYFEFCFELAWKTAKAALEESGILDCQSPRAALKHAFAQGWIDDEAVWLDMLASRNRMTHTYEAGSALLVYDKLKNYAPALMRLYEILAQIR